MYSLSTEVSGVATPVEHSQKYLTTARVTQPCTSKDIIDSLRLAVILFDSSMQSSLQSKCQEVLKVQILEAREERRLSP